MYVVSRTPLLAGLDNQRAERKPADDPVANRKELRCRPRAQRKFRYQRAACCDLLGQGTVALRIDLVEPRSKHGDRPTAGFERGRMGDSVDTDRQTADNGNSGSSQLADQPA